MYYRHHDSPLGPLFLAGDENGLQLLLMELDSRAEPEVLRRDG